MGIAESFKVLFSKYQKQAFIKQAGNREWVIFIETIGTTCHRLPLFFILKGKRWKDDWYPSNMEKNSGILVSENVGTDNKLCMEWMRDCWEPATKIQLQSKYRMLIVDGHVSHVTNEIIKFTQKY